MSETDGPESPSEETKRGGWIRTAAPWAIAAAILGYLIATADIDALSDALARASLWQLGLLAVGFVCAILVADSFAMWVGFREAIPALPLRLGQVVTIRGASYLLAVVNYGAGQGGIVYFLARSHKVPVAVSAGAVLLTSGAFIIVLALAVGTGLLAGAVPDMPELRWVALAVVASLPVYFAIIALRPQFLARWSLLRPLFDAGVLGTLRVAGARAIHLAVLVVGHWTAMRIFGIEVPMEVALALLPVLFLVAAVPISPSGLGTTQAAAITLFGAYAGASGDAAREAQVLAYSLSFHVVATALIALIGLICLRKMTTPESAFDTSEAGP